MEQRAAAASRRVESWPFWAVRDTISSLDRISWESFSSSGAGELRHFYWPASNWTGSSETKRSSSSRTISSTGECANQNHPHLQNIVSPHEVSARSSVPFHYKQLDTVDCCSAPLRSQQHQLSVVVVSKDNTTLQRLTIGSKRSA